MLKKLSNSQNRGDLSILKNELVRSRGSQEGEIVQLETLKGKINNLYNETNIKNEFCLKDFSEFEDRRVDGERRIEEFEGGTATADKILDSTENA
jgi:hypothetical protein